MWKESYGNPLVDNPTYAKDFESRVKKTLAIPLENITGREASKGLTQMKDEKNLNSQIRKNLLKDDSDLYDPKKSAIVSFYSLSSKYLYLRDLAKNKGIPLTKDELTKLTILSWNEPINKVGDSLVKYGNFDSTWEAYNKNSVHDYTAAFSVYDNVFKKNISTQ
jgi:hypothetical protein